MVDKGISFRLNTHITSIAIIIISLIVYTNYYLANKFFISKIEEGTINKSNLVISKIARLTVGTEEITKNVSYQVLYFNRNNDLKEFISKVKDVNNFIEGIYVEIFDSTKNEYQKYSTDIEGIATCIPEKSHTEKYFGNENLNGKFTKAGFWSEPFYCKNDTSHLLVAHIVPLFNQQKSEIIGIVSCELSLQKLSEILAQIKIGIEGFTFIIDKNGTFITHPNSNWILAKNLFEKPSVIFYKKINLVEQKIKTGVKGYEIGKSPYLNNLRSWFYFSPLENTGWTVISVFPEREILNEMNSIFNKIILFSLLGILILFILNMIVFRRLLDPLARVTNAIHKFTSPNKNNITSRNEINLLAESLENWETKYDILMNEKEKTANEKLKFEKDLKSASEIQSNIFPVGRLVFKDYPNIDLCAKLIAAETVSGDLYDYFFIDKNHLLIAIGDVSGKGIPASLFMVIASTLIKTHAKSFSSKEIVSRVNKELSDRNANQYFLTLFLGIIDLRTGVMDYCNAAHNYPYILSPEKSLNILTKSHGLPLGIYKDKTYKSSQIELKYNDMLFLYTDGIINAINIKNEYYGIERLEKDLNSYDSANSKEFIEYIHSKVLFFEGGIPQSDDITILAFKYIAKEKSRV